MPEACGLILVHKGNNMRMDHIGTRGLVCSSKGLEVLPDIGEGLLWVYGIPPRVVFAEQVVVMHALYSY